jgi:DNA polymerase-3 subunit beta
MTAPTIAPPATDIAFTVEARPFAAITEQIARRVPRRPSIPTLGGLLLEVADGTLTLSAFDYEVAARAHINVVGDVNGRAVVSGRLLAELVKTFPDKPVTARVDGTKLAVTCGSVKLTLPLMPAEDYPALPDVPPTVGVVDAETFKAAVEQVAVAAGTEPAVPALTGIHMRLAGTAITLLASDRYRATTVTVPWQPTDPAINTARLVPADVLVDAVKDTTGHIAIGLDGDHLAGFTTDTRSITTRLLANDPPYPQQTLDGFFAAAAAGAVAQIRTADLATAVHRAQLVVAKTAPAVLVFSGGQVNVNGADDAAAGEDLTCEYDGPDITVRVRPQFLLDGLAALRSPNVALSMTDPKKPVLLAAPDAPDGAYRHLIMPIRPGS